MAEVWAEDANAGRRDEPKTAAAKQFTCLFSSPTLPAMSEQAEEHCTMEIKDRVFIVTGASSGIGLSTAIALSDRGAKVALLARSTDALKELAQKRPDSLPFMVDMTQFDRVRKP
jgi:hypothetical protein